MKRFINGELRDMTEDELRELEELARVNDADRIDELKSLLRESDYRTLKYVEGELGAEEFAASCRERAAWRAEINLLEEN